MIVKVKIIKKHIKKPNGILTTYKYPKEYDANIFSPFIYQHEGLKEEYCLANVDSDFKKFTNDIEKITKTQAKKIINKWTNNNISLKQEDRDKYKELKLLHINN